MEVLLSVLDDLFQFARTGLWGVVPYVHTHVPDGTLSESKSSMPIADDALGSISAALAISSETITDQANSSAGCSAQSFRIGELYFVGSFDMHVHTDPVRTFDSAIQSMPYGTRVRLHALQGRWAQVAHGETVGWMLKDALMDSAQQVYPYFEPNVLYDAMQAQTVKLRACIDDMFGGARGEYELTSAEYVTYALRQKKRHIQWGSTVGRVAGTWQRKLRGVSGIHMGVTPKTESVMEYVIDDVGHLAFVEAVFPDLSIKISQIGKNMTPQYTESTLLQEDWIELRPVYIEVT